MKGYRATRIIMTKAQTSHPAGFTVFPWPVTKQGDEGPGLSSAQTPLQPSFAGGGCISEDEVCCKPYLRYLSLLPAIWQVSKVKESVVGAAGSGGGADSGRGPHSIPTQLPSVQQFEVPPV